MIPRRQFTKVSLRTCFRLLISKAVEINSNDVEMLLKDFCPCHFKLYSLFLLAGVEYIKDALTPMHWCKAFENGIQAIKR